MDIIVFFYPVVQNNYEYYNLMVLILQKVQVDEAIININLHMKSKIWPLLVYTQNNKGLKVYLLGYNSLSLEQYP